MRGLGSPGGHTDELGSCHTAGHSMSAVLTWDGAFGDGQLGVAICQTGFCAQTMHFLNPESLLLSHLTQSEKQMNQAYKSIWVFKIMGDILKNHKQNYTR